MEQNMGPVQNILQLLFALKSQDRPQLLLKRHEYQLGLLMNLDLSVVDLRVIDRRLKRTCTGEKLNPRKILLWVLFFGLCDSSLLQGFFHISQL